MAKRDGGSSDKKGRERDVHQRRQEKLLKKGRNPTLAKLFERVAPTAGTAPPQKNRQNRTVEPFRYALKA